MILGRLDLFVMVLFLVLPKGISASELNCKKNALRNKLVDLRDNPDQRASVHPSSGRIDDKVAIYWYPSAGFVMISHTELQVGEQVWTGEIEYRKKDYTASDARDKALGGKKAFFKFDVSVTPEELSNLQAFLAEGKLSWNMCTGATCKALSKTTGLFVPFPFNKIPTLNAIYLTAMSKVGYSRIPNVTYVGSETPAKSLLRGTPEIVLELLLVGDGGRWVIGVSITVGTVVYNYIVHVNSRKEPVPSPSVVPTR